jgi:apolipoprotein N-acyltransferase
VWRRRGLAALSGALLVLSAPPFDLSLLAFGTPAILWWLIRPDAATERPLASAFRIGWLAGFVAALGAFWWVIGLLDRFAHLPLPASILLYLLLCAWGAVAWGVAALAARAAAPRGMGALAVLPAALAAAERFFPQVFPWPIATSQHGFLTLIQVADLGGPYVVSFLVCVVGVALTESAVGRRRTALVAGAAFALAVGYGIVRIDGVEARRVAAPKRTVALVQPSQGIDRKHDPHFFSANVRQLQEMSVEAERRGADLVVWPETSYPYPMPRSGDALARRARRVRRGFSADLVFGVVTEEPAGEHWNSAFLLTADGRVIGPADKRILLAFGEYIPLYGVLPMLRRAFPRSGGFTRGSAPEVLDDGRLRIGIMNCYEDVLPEMSLELASAERPPNLLLNVTNDAWFGDTSEPHLHAALAVYRAVELRRDLARAVNTGVSSFVDATGRVVRASETFRPALLVEDVALLEGRTVYARIGDAFAWACLAGVLTTIGLRRLRRS